MHSLFPIKVFGPVRSESSSSRTLVANLKFSHCLETFGTLEMSSPSLGDCPHIHNSAVVTDMAYYNSELESLNLSFPILFQPDIGRARTHIRRNLNYQKIR